MILYILVAGFISHTLVGIYLGLSAWSSIKQVSHSLTREINKYDTEFPDRSLMNSEQKARVESLEKQNEVFDRLLISRKAFFDVMSVHFFWWPKVLLDGVKK